MEVRFDGGQYTFQLRSDTALFAPVVESVANTPNAAVENAIKELQQLAGGGSRYSATMTREVIRSAGIQLWSEMVPADVRDQFWQVGADMSCLHHRHRPRLGPVGAALSAQRGRRCRLPGRAGPRRTPYLPGQRRNPRVGLRNPRFVVPPKASTRTRFPNDGCPALTNLAQTALTLREAQSAKPRNSCHFTIRQPGSLPAGVTFQEIIVRNQQREATQTHTRVNSCSGTTAARWTSQRSPSRNGDQVKLSHP